jgi:hypothetical protein
VRLSHFVVRTTLGHIRRQERKQIHVVCRWINEQQKKDSFGLWIGAAKQYIAYAEELCEGDCRCLEYSTACTRQIAHPACRARQLYQEMKKGKLFNYTSLAFVTNRSHACKLLMRPRETH